MGVKARKRHRERTMINTTRHRYIVQDDTILGGEPIIEGTRTPVRAVVETWRLGTPPEQIPQSYPHLTLAQIFDALSYYSDHQAEINGYIERNRVPDELVDPLVKGDRVANPYPLRGLPVSYDRPTEPVGIADWEVLR